MTEPGSTRPTSIAVRHARVEDAEDVHRLLVDLGYTGVAPSSLREVLVAVLEHPDRTVLVAETNDGAVVGLAALSHMLQLRHAAPIVVVEELVVREGARGTGIGRLLLHEVREVARRVRASRIELHTNRERPSYLRGFYVKNGLTEVNSAVMREELGGVGR